MNRTALITGATGGLGRALARQFAVSGFDLVVHGRDDARLESLAAEITALGADVRTVRADITEPEDVAGVAFQVLDALDSLDVLVNNAAVGGGTDPTRREVNSGDHELRMVGNYLGPYQLNRALAPLLSAAPQGRIINVASIGQAPIDLADIGFTREYDGVEAYCRSKLALIMDTIDLADLLRGSGTTVNAVHPAHLMATTMVSDSGFVPATTVEDGMLPVLRLALDSSLATTTGRYFDRFEIAEPHPQARDAGVRAALGRLAHAALSESVASRS
ncbi:SDR family NAD(P)-dependent oxidoreductase [Solicola gregarius]|uniref:SDR family NAD(P)-dependent oxidoreductase n=1 Tax=Solicola gregarius TaxID=2908642 RepID=A0AA46TIY7_9ACTN|nr:SDR family NAD(P)-dependent oxidoreductase [Solicola gregarius]UYM06219.1 SDR family NAD(P)-dependent oxidoreductase [Solicola gregarius]